MSDKSTWVQSWFLVGSVLFIFLGFCVVLLCILMLRVVMSAWKRCAMSLPPVVCRRTCVLFMLFVFYFRKVVSNTYCVMFLFCFSSSCIPYVVSFSGMSISYCVFGILECFFTHTKMCLFTWGTKVCIFFGPYKKCHFSHTNMSGIQTLVAIGTDCIGSCKSNYIRSWARRSHTGICFVWVIQECVIFEPHRNVSYLSRTRVCHIWTT